MTGIIRAHGIIRNGSTYAVTVAGAPHDTRAGHEHRAEIVPVPVDKDIARRIFDRALAEGVTADFIKDEQRGTTRYTFGRGVEFDLAPYWDREQAVVENRPFNEGDLY